LVEAGIDQKIIQFLNNQVDITQKIRLTISLKIPMALNFQSHYYIITTYHFCQVDYRVLNTTASNRLNNTSKSDLHTLQNMA